MNPACPSCETSGTGLASGKSWYRHGRGPGGLVVMRGRGFCQPWRFLLPLHQQLVQLEAGELLFLLVALLLESQCLVVDVGGATSRTAHLPLLFAVRQHSRGLPRPEFRGLRHSLVT